ncbi:hypothetical protein LIP66_01530 [Coprococcus eutactus]|uniref:hypothetical protein n=1 Tax=Coprococcus eutactus TaxID=33043 RepID=UPI00156F6F9F|nr:hypothetical protein [Coprococcus eutactus]MCB5503326.1 hypothetical protein [Coprococcus eutactus]NSC95149.1 hypothetical protein [Coprococcus eutactus]NSD34221.1 hypothetical protein [Coprococcus eutactus]
MPSLQTARRIANAKTNNAKTLGQIYKEQSDWAMEQTWDNDIQSKICYIYDFYHDDQPRLAEGMTYENTTKTRIDAKFIVKSYQSMDKDQVEYYIQFKPTQKTHFSEGDELYYFETDYRKKYHNDNFIGLFIDIPNDENIYEKWMILRTEPANQFPKYLILKCNYELMWIENNGTEKIKRRMWSVLKIQSSYNSGLWTDLRFTSQENQDKVWLPLNPITEKIWYTNESSKNMRVLVSSFTDNAIAWQISKVENAQPLGVQKLTLYQDFFDQHRDYIEKDSDGNIIGMWASYFDSEIAPTNPSTPTTPPSSITARISASTSTIKVGGSYKNLMVNLFNDSNEDITTEYADATFTWACSIDNEDWTDKVTWRVGTEYNQKKVKFSNDTSVIGKILSVKCEIVKDNLPIESEILPLELTE